MPAHTRPTIRTSNIPPDDPYDASYQPTDPIVNANFSPYSPSVTSPSRQRTLSFASVAPPLHPTEDSPLIAPQPSKKPFLRPRPLWLVPFAIAASVVPTHHDGDDDEPDPRAMPSHRCLSDPKVQAGAARIQTIMTTIAGFLSALTTGWWGHFGERYGRTRVLAAATVGLFLTDLTFILVSTPHSIFAAHGHKFLVVSPLIEGALGGWATLQGATSAYVSDCTSDGSRAQIFSRFAGVFYLGFSLGPAIGAYLIRHPLNMPGFPSTASGGIHNGQPTVTSVFYVAAVASFVNLLLVLFVFPESLDKKRAEAAREAAALGLDTIEDDEDADAKPQGFLARFFGPLAIFTPKTIQMPDGRHRSDWTLTILGLSLFGYLLSTGVFQIKYLYAGHVYAWGAEQLSYYISFVGLIRAVHLLFVMPCASHMAKLSIARTRTFRDVILILVGATCMHLASSFFGFLPEQFTGDIIVSTHINQHEAEPIIDEIPLVAGPPVVKIPKVIQEAHPKQDAAPPPPPPSSSDALDLSFYLPETTIDSHAPGWTLFTNLYMSNGTLFIVSSQPASTFPSINFITSTGLAAENTPENKTLQHVCPPPKT
ncbi:hypothetical protein EIP91_000589 [Steccherinum ochraceum]|uniref:Major facilitator superfamily (MFS) profile domain-containing protein n=1 Tax=Steccherinum ochraceum TaxID=92696 RepID=A0A4R0RI12_9APHY|nr:hypothetical protein EIP91_000589 [Steccherinum ochraceum]